MKTNSKRYENRYFRRKMKRDFTKKSSWFNFDEIFTYEHLYKSYQKCRKGVSWKNSVQKYITNAPLLIKRLYDKLHTGKFKSQGFYEFDIFERGKKRHIKSVSIEERIVQKCLCDYSLIPALKRKFIYDNSACLKHKGYHFAIKRLICHLEKHYRKNGNDGYILLYDFKKFYDNISHKIVYRIIDKEFTDMKLNRLIHQLVDAFGKVGLGLGSQVSQILALSVGNEIDRFIKQKLYIKQYARYNDDGYLIHPSKKYLRYCLKGLKSICKSLDIKINTKKTTIVKLSHVFKFLKIKISLKNNGEILKRISRESCVRIRRKIKSFKKMYDVGEMSITEVDESLSSWLGYARQYHSYNSIRNVKILYSTLFPEGRIKWATLKLF